MIQIESIKYSVPPDIAIMMNKLCEYIEVDIIKQVGALPPEIMIKFVGNIIKTFGESVIEIGSEKGARDEPIN